MARALVHMPSAVRRGAVFEIRVVIAHPMETGYRPGADGRVLPRDIIRQFACRYNGETVFSAQLHPAIAANPFIAFHTLATESGTLEFEWRGDNGFAQVESMPITVT